jgi:hypothetical protein
MTKAILKFVVSTEAQKSDDYVREVMFETIFSSLWRHVTDNKTKVGDYIDVVFAEEIPCKHLYSDITIPLEEIDVDVVFGLARYMSETKTAIFFVKRIDRRE